jgi:hypothetical protein
VSLGRTKPHHTEFLSGVGNAGVGRRFIFLLVEVDQDMAKKN